VYPNDFFLPPLLIALGTTTTTLATGGEWGGTGSFMHALIRLLLLNFRCFCWPKNLFLSAEWEKEVFFFFRPLPKFKVH
jgi:hypothetical protein